MNKKFWIEIGISQIEINKEKEGGSTTSRKDCFCFTTPTKIIQQQIIHKKDKIKNREVPFPF